MYFPVIAAVGASLLATTCAISAQTSPFPVPGGVVNRTKSLLVVNGDGLTHDELLLLQSLQGVGTFHTTGVYRNTSNTDNGAPLWLNTLVETGVATTTTSTLPDALHFFVAQGWVTGYVFVDLAVPGDPSLASVSAGVTYASAHTGVVVGTAASSPLLEGAGVKMVLDARNLTTSQVLAQGGWPTRGGWSTKVSVMQDPSKLPTNLVDYVLGTRAVAWFDSTSTLSSPITSQVLDGLDTPAATVGWGATEIQTVSRLTRAGSWMNAADWGMNLGVLSQYRLPGSPPGLPASTSRGGRRGGGGVMGPTQPSPLTTTTTTTTTTTPPPVHTVAFLFTDGDNVQWLLNTFATDPKWWGSPLRGSVPLGWTISAALQQLAPAAMHYLRQTATANDSFVAASSGAGYAYPDLMDSDQLSTFAAISSIMMQEAGMNNLNVLGVDYSTQAATALAQQEGVNSILWYDYDPYSALQGNVTFINDKVVTGSRFQLWNGTFCDPAQLVAKLQSMPKDPTVAEGYSLVDVEVWTNDVEDVVGVVRALEADGGFRVVTPTQLVEELKANLKP